MKLKKKRNSIPRNLCLLIHKDGTALNVFLHNSFKVRLCFTDLEHYYSNLHILFSNMNYYNEIMESMINSIYDEAKKKYKQLHNKDIVIDFGNL